MTGSEFFDEKLLTPRGPHTEFDLWQFFENVKLRHCPVSSANSRPFCSPEVILTVLHVLNICTFYYDSRRYFSYIVRCPGSHYWLYATLISSLMMMMMIMMMWDSHFFVSQCTIHRTFVGDKIRINVNWSWQGMRDLPASEKISRYQKWRYCIH